MNEGRHYWEPLEERTYATYGGITRDGSFEAHKAGVVITGLVAPTEGWPIVAHCEICKKTEIILSIFAKKPERGDYWLMRGVCLDEEHCVQHNLYPQSVFPWSPPVFLSERSILK
jgi:hypothetical protein